MLVGAGCGVGVSSGPWRRVISTSSTHGCGSAFDGDDLAQQRAGLPAAGELGAPRIARVESLDVQVLERRTSPAVMPQAMWRLWPIRMPGAPGHARRPRRSARHPPPGAPRRTRSASAETGADRWPAAACPCSSASPDTTHALLRQRTASQRQRRQLARLRASRPGPSLRDAAARRTRAARRRARALAATV